MELEISAGFYAKKAVEDTVYWLSERYTIAVRIGDDGYYVIKCSNSDSEFESIFMKHLNDFNLRASIVESSSKIKDLVIAKAFYPEIINIDPIGDFDDPVLMDDSHEAE